MRSAGRWLLGGAAVVAAAVPSSAVRADDLADLKSAISAIDSRVARMEALPALPEGARLISMWQGPLAQVPGAPLPWREVMAYGERSTYIGVLPTAAQPVGASIAWSGYTRFGVVYEGNSTDTRYKTYVKQDGQWVRDPALDQLSDSSSEDTKLKARGQLLVKAKTGTSVGEVGVKLELRGNFEGNTPAQLEGKVAWGYWDITHAVTLGGGYDHSVGNITYGYDGSCTCYYTDNADMDFNPGDTTQLRLSYLTGPVTFDIALESAAIDNSNLTIPNSMVNRGLLGVAGHVSYAGKQFSGEFAGVWRGSNERETGSNAIWQLGLGGKYKLADKTFLSLAAALGEGPYEEQTTGTIVRSLGYNNLWWGVSGLGSLALTDKTHAELAAGYKKRIGMQSEFSGYQIADASYHTYAVMGGLYYTPVKQLTLGLESEWYTTLTSAIGTQGDLRYDGRSQTETLWADVVALWRF